jgi:hypothetical protein
MTDKAMIEYFWGAAKRNPKHDINWDDPTVIRFAESIAKYERHQCAKFLQKTINPLKPEYIDQIKEGIWND